MLTLGPGDAMRVGDTLVVSMGVSPNSDTRLAIVGPAEVTRRLTPEEWGRIGDLRRLAKDRRAQNKADRAAYKQAQLKG